ncbi:pectate lyase-like [Cornus florida]|uniref:pectate lyase-like n=1 Tax=Cornus florida TaxID=4283 RepID=UPI00289B7E53|nr:pectate lyase-like [Cornus florida]
MAFITSNSNNILFFFLCLASIVPSLRAHVKEFDQYWQVRAKEALDDYWQIRAKEAHLATLDAHHPNPEEVTDHFNMHVAEALVGGTNSTRRGLRKHRGKCKATNPIDRCWRCRPDWATNRKRLADCVLGFGRNTTGGKYGEYYLVNDPSDDDMQNPKPGTLRYAVIQEKPLWIIFSRSMTIRLNQELIMTSHKTIDARGVNVHIAYGAGITIQYVKNIIIHGLRIHDIVPGSGGIIRDSENHFGLRTRSDGDAISIFGSSKVWIDHVSMSNCTDGLIDAIMGSTAITISNCHFTRHNEVMLFGASDEYSDDAKMQITVAFNHFGHGLTQRMPRCRWGFVHVVNNDYTHWLMYAIGGSSHPTIISQGNRFIAPPDNNCKQVTMRVAAPESEWRNWQWRSEGDLMMNGAYFVESGAPLKNKPFSRLDMIKAKSGTEVTRLTRNAGALNCYPNSPC